MAGPAPAPPSLDRAISTSSDMAEGCRIEGCTRRSYNCKAGELCCLECEQSGGAAHSAHCDELQECVLSQSRWRKAVNQSTAEKLSQFATKSDPGSEVADPEDLVDTVAVGEMLRKVDASSWTKERSSELFRIMNTREETELRFSDLHAWASSYGPEKDLSAVPVGGEVGKIGITIKAALGGGGFAARIAADVPRGFLMNVSKGTTPGAVVQVLSLWLGLPPNGVTLVTESDGIALTNLDSSLEDNGVTLPGPAARRKGERLGLLFDTISPDVVPASEALIKLLDAETWARGQAERDQVAKHRAAIGKALREEEARRNRSDDELDLDEYICRNVAVTKEKFDELNADRRKMDEWIEKGYADADRNYLVEETDPVAIKTISDLIGKRVLRLYRNENALIQERYERAKERLRNSGRRITRESTETQKRISGEPPLDKGGPYDPAINEYPMWHGTGRAGVRGIMRTNFDIHRCGAHGLAYGTGFYFADDPRTSAGYSSIGSHDRVGTGSRCYTSVGYMLLNRVMCGNIKHFERMPHSHAEFEKWTADCIGKGGVWAGKDADYECIRSPGTFCWVAVHTDQIWPAYLIVYQA